MDEFKSIILNEGSQTKVTNGMILFILYSLKSKTIQIRSVVAKVECMYVVGLNSLKMVQRNVLEDRINFPSFYCGRGYMTENICQNLTKGDFSYSV